MYKSRKFRRSLLAASLTLILALQWLPPASSALADEADDHELTYEEMVAQASEFPVPEVPAQPPLPAEAQVPAPGAWTQDGITETAVAPEPTLPANPETILDDAELLPEEGGPTFDVYSPEGDDPGEIAQVYQEQVNFETEDGQWLNIDFSPEVDGVSAGWKVDDNGVFMRFPQNLSARDPIRYSTAGGNVVIAPEGADAAGNLQANTITYADVLASTDASYRIQPDGFKESLVLKTPEAPESFSWILTTDLTPSIGPEGEIDLSNADALVAQLPTPLIWDSAADPLNSTSTYALETIEPGKYRIRLALDATFLASATYPVTVDPGLDGMGIDEAFYATNGKDFYANNSNAWDNDHLEITGSRNTWVKFDLSGIDKDDRLVYDSVLYFMKHTSGCPNADQIGLRRSQSPISPDSPFNPPNVDPSPTSMANNYQQDWIQFRNRDLDEIVQAWVDTDPSIHKTNNGFRLSRENGAADCKLWSSSAWSGQANDGSEPTMFVWYNDLPSAPELKAGYLEGDGVIVNEPSPNLILQRQIPGQPNPWPSDPNDDDTLIRFQVSSDLDCEASPDDELACDWNIAGKNNSITGNWQDSLLWQVPGGFLVDGQTYIWRAQSADQCENDPKPDNKLYVCDEIVDDNPEHQYAATETRKFTVSLPKYGTDSNWSMFSQDAGNGVSLNINESTGNVFADVPLASLGTVLGPLDVALSYNSQQTGDVGLGDGWDIAIGPEAAGEMPTRLTVKTPQPDAGVSIRFRSGNIRFYPYQDGHVYGGSGADAGVVTKSEGNEDEKWTFRNGRGGLYTFDDHGQLMKATPEWATTDQGNTKSVSYFFDQVTTPDGPSPDEYPIWAADPIDPEHKKIELAWSADNVDGRNPSEEVRLLSIDTWPSGVDDYLFSYDTNGALTAIELPEKHGATTGETLSFGYSDYSSQTLLTTFANGQQSLDTGAYPPWSIDYTIGSAPAFYSRATALWAPNAPEAWRFAYQDASPSYSVDRVVITDPLDESFDTTGASIDHEVVTEFNSAGLAIRTQGPATFQDPPTWNSEGYIDGPSRPYIPVSYKAWDTNNLLVCEQSAAATAAVGGPFVASETRSEWLEASDCISPSGRDLRTRYEYEDRSPYRLVKVTHPSPATIAGVPNGERATEAYAYDEGANFNGIWTEYFRSTAMSGIPMDEGMFTQDMNKSWTSPPSQVDNNDNDWAVRYSGYLDLRNKTKTEKYRFRLFSGEGALLTIGNKTLVSCLNDESQNSNDYNCGTNAEARKTLDPGLRPFTLEFANASGSADLELKWDNGDANGGFSDIGQNDLRANRGLLTTKVTNSEVMTTYTFNQQNGAASDSLMKRGLYDSKTVSDTANTAETRRRSEYAYDVYGNATEEIVAAGTSAASRTVSTYGTGGCLTERSVGNTLTHLTGATTYFECNAAGNVTKQTVVVRSVSGTRQSTIQRRITFSEYDAMGRPTSYEVWSGDDNFDPVTRLAATQTTYDFQGRVDLSKKLLSDGGTQVWATTNNDYSFGSYGPMTVTWFPVSPARQIHQYDWAGNEAWTSGPVRQGTSLATTTRTFDPSGRVISSTSPLGHKAFTTYRLTASNGTYQNQVITTPPDFVDSTSTMDLLGRQVQQDTEASLPVSTDYDIYGRVVRTDAQTSGATISSTTDYTLFGEVWKKTDFAETADAATIEYTYNAAGQMTKIDGPRSIDDTVEVDYDLYGRVIQTRMPGVKVPNPDGSIPASPSPATTDITYDDAGEQVKVTTKLTTATTMSRDWTFDEAGRMSSYRSGRNEVTDFAYDTGGRLITTTLPQGASAPCGQISGQDAVCRVLSSQYDAAGNQVGRWAQPIEAAGPSDPRFFEEEFTFDTGNRITWAGNDSAYASIGYDKESRLVSVNQNGDASTTYGYYSATASTVELRGKASSVSDAVGYTAYDYNTSGSAVGKLASVEDPLSGQATNYSYYSDGRLQGRADPAGLNWHLDYDANTGRVGLETVTRGTSDPVASFNPSYDLAGNVTGMVQTLEGAGNTSTANPENGTWTYHYDEASRLDSAILDRDSGPDLPYAYCYDAAGNRLKNVACNASGVTTTYDAAGLPVSEGTKTFTHDGAGNLLKVESGGAVQSSYGFDAWGRLTSATAGSQQVSYVNDALGRTISRTQGTQTTALTYQGVGETLVREVGASTIDYAQSPQGPLAQRVGSDVSFFIKNPHGDVVATAASANLSSSLAYSPYGEVIGSPGSTLGYQGQRTDAATGLVDMTTRHYDPTMGRFISQDVLFGDLNSPMSLNQYAYAAGNPVGFGDLSGMGRSGGHATVRCLNNPYGWNCPLWAGPGSVAPEDPLPYWGWEFPDPDPIPPIPPPVVPTTTPAIVGPRVIFTNACPTPYSSCSDSARDGILAAARGDFLGSRHDRASGGLFHASDSTWDAYGHAAAADADARAAKNMWKGAVTEYATRVSVLVIPGGAAIPQQAIPGANYRAGLKSYCNLGYTEAAIKYGSVFSTAEAFRDLDPEGVDWGAYSNLFSALAPKTVGRIMLPVTGVGTYANVQCWGRT